MRWQRLIYIFIAMCLCLYSGYSNAQQAAGIGLVAGNMLAPIDMLRQMMNAASIILGLYMLTAAITRYFRFRQNPQESPISTVIMWGILGIVLIVIPLLHHFAVVAAVQTGAGDVVT